MLKSNSGNVALPDFASSCHDLASSPALRADRGKTGYCLSKLAPRSTREGTR